METLKGVVIYNIYTLVFRLQNKYIIIMRYPLTQNFSFYV